MSASSRAYEYAKRLLHRITPRHAVARHHKHSPFCEPLENRMLLSTVTVTGTMDVVDGDTSSIAALIATPGDDGVITLREAVQAANNSEGEDIIEFDQALEGQTITLGSTLNVMDSLSIVGLGEDQLTISSVGLDVVFDVDLGVHTEATLGLADFTITGAGQCTVIDALYTDVVLGQITFQGVGEQNHQLKICCAEFLSVAPLTIHNADFYIEADQITLNDTLSGGGIIDLTARTGITLETGAVDGIDGSGVTFPDGNNVGSGSSVIPGGGSGSGSVTLEGYGSSGSGGGGTITVGEEDYGAESDYSNAELVTSYISSEQSIYLNDGQTLVINTDAKLHLTDSSKMSIVDAGEFASGNNRTVWNLTVKDSVFSMDGEFILEINGAQIPITANGGELIVEDDVALTVKANQPIVTINDVIQFKPPNTVPIAHDVFGTATEDGPTVTFVFDATDPDTADTLTYQILSQPAGNLINNGNGTFSYTAGDWQQLNDDMHHDISFTYRVIDNHGAASEPATVTLTLQGQSDIADGPNAAPVAIPKLVKTDSRTLAMIDVVSNVVDPDGDTVFVWAPDGVSDLGVPLQVGFSGEVFYDPTGYFDGYEVGQRVRDCFTVEVYDAYGNADRTKVFVDVIIAAAPVATLASNGPVVLHSQAPRQMCDMVWAPAAELAMVSATVQPVGTTAPGWLQSLLQSGHDDQHVDRLRLMLVEG